MRLTRASNDQPPPQITDERCLPQFARSPTEYNGSEGYFRVLCLVTALWQQCGVRYAEGFVPCRQWLRGTTRRLLP